MTTSGDFASPAESLSLTKEAVPGASAGSPAREVWSSRFTFVYSTIAACVGLGSLWRFPYVAGANGGGAFVLLYIFFVLALCVPLVIAETLIGKRGHGSTVGSINLLVDQERASRMWRLIGWLSLLIPFVGLSYYSVVAGWCMDYARIAITRGFSSASSGDSLRMFNGLIASPWHQVLLQVTFIFAAALIVARGLHRGIERIAKVKMIVLCGVLAILVLYNAREFGLGPAVSYLFRPDFSRITVEGVLAAFGQALFSTSIGIGVLMTFGSYLPRGTPVPHSILLYVGGILAAALTSGLAIFPIALHYGANLDGGPDLVFVALTVPFSRMAGGRIIGMMFFSLLALSAFTCAIGMLEPVISWLEEKLTLGRGWLCALAAVVLCIVGLPPLLSFSVLKDVHPLAWLPLFHDRTIFGVLDFGIANFMLPLNAILIALFVGWVLAGTRTSAEFPDAPIAHAFWKLILRFIAPLAIVVLMASL